MSKRYAAILIALVVALVGVFVMRDRKHFYSHEGVVWTTEYHITYEATHDLGDSIQIIFNHLDNSVSPYNKASLITALNNNTSTQADGYICRLLKASWTVNHESGGAFDFTLGKISDLWGIGTDNERVPEEDEIKAALDKSGADKTGYDGGTFTVPEGLSVDMGAAGKGID